MTPHPCDFSFAVRALAVPFRDLHREEAGKITGAQKHQPLIQLLPLLVLLLSLMVFVMYSAACKIMYELC